MKTSDDLHQLIRSMSMSEKRHFKIHSARHTIGQGNNYALLFDAIAKQEIYDESALKKQFHGETFIRHLPSGKNYLYHHVIDSLNIFHRDKTFFSRYAQLITTIEILFNRGLFSQCKKVIRKAKTEAYRVERFSMLLLILRWETLLYIKDEDDRNLNKSIAEELRLLEVIRVQSTLMQIAFNIQIRVDKGNVPATYFRSMEKLLKQSLPSTPQWDSFWAKYYYHSAMGLLYSIRDMHEERYQCYKDIQELMTGAPQFIRDLPGVYHLNINNLVNVMFLLGKYGEAELLIARQRLFPEVYAIKRPALSRIVFLQTYESELYLYYKTGRYADGAATAKKIEHEVRKIELSFSPLLFDLFFMLAITELMEKNYKAATRWLNRLLNAEREASFRKELQVNARLLYLVVLFESHDVLFDNRLAAAKRFIGQEKQYKTQLHILEVIRLLAEDLSDPKNKAGLKKHVAVLQKKNKISVEESLNKQFDFREWIGKKIAALTG